MLRLAQFLTGALPEGAGVGARVGASAGAVAGPRSKAGGREKLEGGSGVEARLAAREGAVAGMWLRSEAGSRGELGRCSGAGAREGEVAGPSP